MPNWFVYTADGTKKGPITTAQLKALANAGKINSETIIEADSGQKGKAGQIKGLIPSATSSPSATPQAAAGNGVFCTSCGSPISPQAVACMKCGADPKAHQKFCRHCGVQLNPNQVICVKCGSPVASTASSSMGSGSDSQTNSSVFCTNCGNSISEQAVACMKCGADPTSQKNFCRQCGAQLNPNQVVCVKCGCSVKVKKKSDSSGNGLGDGEKSKTLAAIFAFLLGEFGAHKFYLGDQKWGIIHIVLTIAGFMLMFIGSMLGEIDNWLSFIGSMCAISGFMCIIVVSVKCLVDCIKLLLMSEDDFQER